MSQLHPKTLKLIKNWITKHKIIIFVFLKHFQADSVHKHSISQFYIVPKCHFETELLVREPTFCGDGDSYVLNFSCNARVS